LYRGKLDPAFPMRGSYWFLVCVLVTTIACTTSPSQRTVADGVWGGDHASLSVSDTPTVEFDCAHGTLQAPLALDSAGDFDVQGTFTQDQPSTPINVGAAQTTPSQSAEYSGMTDGRTLTFSVTVPSSSQTLGPFNLTLGQPARLLKCQ
jgi:hypothetical protein